MARPPFEMIGAARPTVESRETVGRRPVDRPLGRRGADILARVPLFAGLSRRHLRNIAGRSDLVSFRQGSPVVEAGMPGGSMFVILQGQAKVVRGGKVVAHLRPGEFFGEISLLDEGPRTASVFAETPLSAVRVSRRAFTEVIEGEPAVGVKVLEALARRLREMERPLNG